MANWGRRSVLPRRDVEVVMKRADELFAIEGRSSRSPFVEETWWTRSEPEDSFISVAASHWQMCVTRQRGSASLTVRGPQTKATITPIPEGAEFFRIQFSLGTFMPNLEPGQLVDRALRPPEATGTSFWLDRSAWELPGSDNVDVFVDRLVRAGLLVHDPVAPAVLQGDLEGLSTRMVERRVTGDGADPGGYQADPTGREGGRTALRRRARTRRGSPGRVRGPAPSDAIAQALRGADTLPDRFVAAPGRVAVVFVQDGVAHSGLDVRDHAATDQLHIHHP